MDFVRSSAARTANRFRELPLFKPTAERCAFAAVDGKLVRNWTGGRH
jgi:hypothetical protein